MSVPVSSQGIRDYYRCFNERRIADAGTLFARGAMVEMPPFVRGAAGADAYAQFADAWIRAFPDAQFTIERVHQRGDTICEVELLATGTHSGPLDLGVYGVLQPSGVQLTLRLREVLEIRNGKITYASLAFDINHLGRQLTRVDYKALTGCLDTIRQLTDELAQAPEDTERQRDVTERLGRALDAARLVVGPQFKQ
jgi:predicted ester cyclase